MQPLEDFQIFDFDAALGRMGGDREIYSAVALVYLDSIPQLITAIKKGVSQKDNEKVMREAHSAKSSSRIVGADVVGYWAEKLELAGKNGEDSLYSSLIDTIESSVGEVVALIETKIEEMK